MSTATLHRCFLILFAMTLTAAFLPVCPAEAARQKPLHTAKDVKGITFEDFWARAREEGSKWAGTRMRIRRIYSVPVVGFDGRYGRSPVWEAQIVRCDTSRSTSPDEETTTPGKVCKGRAVTLRIVEPGITGAAAGMDISKETAFRGASIPVERIKVSPMNAEETANTYRQYSPGETDSYSYELRYDQRKDRAVWVIKRTCGYKGRSEGRCQQGDYWIVKVDAESGEVIKQ